MSASARSPSHPYSYIVPEHLLLVFLSAAVAEEMFPRLSCPASTAPLQEYGIVLVFELFQVRAHSAVLALRMVVSGCQRLHAIHWDGSVAPRFAILPVALMLAAFISRPFRPHRHVGF